MTKDLLYNEATAATSAEEMVEMEEDGEYRRQLALFSQSSTEKGIELVRIGEIIARLDRRGSFLDIGAGGGHLTIPVSTSFDATTVVEPNAKQAAYLRRRCLGQRCPRFGALRFHPLFPRPLLHRRGQMARHHREDVHPFR